MRSREQVIRDFVQQWIGKAELDIETAKILLDAAMEDYYPCAFHCQQAAEKFLKAYLVRHQIEFRKTHDLGELLRLVGSVDTVLASALASCEWLTPYGVEFRYPGECPEVDRRTAEKAFREAEAVKRRIMEKLEDYLSSEI
ncbi:MAG TPA: HEPN domain-containing protein [Proteobacteria bacterium]|nr:HEPN domain-containing protein [Pseudomonadota bacterium]